MSPTLEKIQKIQTNLLGSCDNETLRQALFEITKIIEADHRASALGYLNDVPEIVLTDSAIGRG